jgi:anti-sigma regulatory factor (Ser/Thr protein kinase)
MPDIPPHSYTLFCPPLPTAPRIARQLVVGALESAGLQRLADVAELATCELVTNAYRHAAGIGSLLWLAIEPTKVRVSVYDGDPTVPAVRRAGPEACGGRGLSMVEDVTDIWGVTLGSPIGLGDTGKGVWFELRC